MKSVFLTLLLWMIAVPALAQNRVEILRANRGTGEQTADGFVRRLTGNVLLRSEKITVATDSAIHYVDKNELLAFGNITITTETDIITTDELFYNTRTEQSRLKGNVEIRRDSTVIYSETTNYDFKTEIAVFRDPIRMVDTKGELQAQRGTYFAKTDSAMVFGNVQVADSTYYIEADSLYSNRTSESHKMFGMVFLHDIKEDTRITGRYVEADSTGRRWIQGDAFIEQIDSTSADTTYLRAADILVTRADGYRTILAIGDVMSWSADYATLSDTTTVFEADSLTILRGSPRAWHKDMQLSGDSLDIHTRNEKIERIIAIGSPSAAQRDSVTLRVHQMKGDTLIISFDDGVLRQFSIRTNANILYHSKTDEDAPDGAIEMSAVAIDVLFEDGDATDVKAVKGITGSYLEESADLDSRRMPGVKWEPEEKPLRPTVRPTPRLTPI